MGRTPRMEILIFFLLLFQARKGWRVATDYLFSLRRSEVNNIDDLDIGCICTFMYSRDCESRLRFLSDLTNIIS